VREWLTCLSRLDIEVRQNGKSCPCPQILWIFPHGDLISAPIDANDIAKLCCPYDLFSYLLHVYPLQAALVIEPSSGAPIGGPANSLQLTRSGNVLWRFMYTEYDEVNDGRRYKLSIVLYQLNAYDCIIYNRSAIIFKMNI
jgi:hypothetical protein